MTYFMFWLNFRTKTITQTTTVIRTSLTTLLDYMSQQSLLLVVLIVTNKHNYELIMFASPIKYSGTNRDVNTLQAIAS